MKSLLLDVGNTRLKWGVAEDGEIHKTGSIAQEKIRDAGIAVLTRRLPRRVDNIIASNVAGATFATRLAGVLHAHCGHDVRFAKSAKSGFGIINSYSQPRRLGVDRWVAMIGARAEIKSACIVVDAGTAVTIDALDKNGQHLGGQIIPGLGLMTAALSNNTSDIPRTTAPTSANYNGLDAFAKNSREAVRAGAVTAVVGAIERAMKAMRSAGHRPKLVLTGGDASRILASLERAPLHRPHLVLQGLLHILNA